jgi:ribonuclease T2
MMAQIMRMRRSLARVLIAVTLTCLLCMDAAQASSHHKKKPANGDIGQGFAYYLLTLSYAPDFCAQPTGNKDARECGTGRHIGFIVHGLWPQGESGRGPENCKSVSPVSQDIIRTMLNYIPTESLIQHEWTSHGSCSGLTAADYFAAIRKARDSITIPTDLKQPSTPLQLSPSQIEAELAAANPAFPNTAFRVSCYRDGELQEARICFNKDLSPRACSASAGECPASSITLRPVR